MQRLSSVLWLVLLIIGSAFLPAQAQPAQAAPAPAPVTVGCPPVPVAASGLQQWGFNELYSVSARTDSDAWAVGAYTNPESNRPFPLIEHWDGANWTGSTPAPNYQPSQLVGVAAVAADDVWAVGADISSAGTTEVPIRPLLEHWNGSAWSQVPVPQPSSPYIYASLTGITAPAANNVWAVGFYNQPNSTSQAFIIHWDGHTWTQVATPAGAGGLSAVSAVAANDIWAVGVADISSAHNMIILHWDGSAWTEVPHPTIPDGSLTAVSARAANDVWAVGSADGATSIPLILHWNGSTWAQAAPTIPTGNSQLRGIVARAVDDVWAVGQISPTQYMPQPSYQPLWEHWNGTSWSIVAAPALEGRLDAVAAGPGTLWTVGAHSQDLAETLITQWTGSSWAAVPSVNVGLARSNVNGLTALTANDAWAVGNFDSYPSTRGGGAAANTLTRHWDGHTWVQIASPNAPNDSFLKAVAGASTNNVWAVGYWGSGGLNNDGALIEQWDGTQWHIVLQGDSNVMPAHLLGVAAVSATDVWAVGFDYALTGGSSYSRSYIVHWDGQTWSRIASPNMGTGDNQLAAVAATATDDVWAVGSANDTNMSQPLLLHWNGVAWSAVPAPALADAAGLAGVWAEGRDNAWAVGRIGSATAGQTLILHWDGSSWTRVASPNAAVALNGLTSVAGHAANDVWAAGYTYTRNGQVRSGPGLLLHWDGTTWSQSTTDSTQAAFFSSVVAPAAGESWVGGANVSTSVAQALILRTSRFNDVTPDDVFYGPINDLVSRGVLTGYSDCTFRPAAATSRGQMSKIVVAAAGWPLVRPAQGHFVDVAPSNVFYAYIETAVAHGLISGYHGDTFRPSDPVTRAQVSKMVVLAAGWAITTAGGPHFSDVPSNNGFYGYVETARAHGILSGYSDGTFRLNASASRGQISQIVSTALPGAAAKH